MREGYREVHRVVNRLLKTWEKKAHCRERAAGLNSDFQVIAGL